MSLLAPAAVLVLFALDVPVALQALRRAAAVAAQRHLAVSPAAAGGLKLGMAKASVLGVGYTLTYAILGVRLWREAGRRATAGS